MKRDRWLRPRQVALFVVAFSLLWVFSSAGRTLRLCSVIAGENSTAQYSDIDLFVPGSSSDLLLSAEPLRGEEATIIREEAAAWQRSWSGPLDYELSVTDLRAEVATPMLRFPLRYRGSAQDWRLELDREDAGLSLETRADIVELAVPWSPTPIAMSRESSGSAVFLSADFLAAAALVGQAEGGRVLVWQLDDAAGAFPSVRCATRRSDGLLLRMASLLAAPTAHLRLDLKLVTEPQVLQQSSKPLEPVSVSFLEVVNDGDD